MNRFATAAVLVAYGVQAVAAATADPMSAYYGNTLNVANAAGVATKFYYNADRKSTRLNSSHT